MQEGKKREYGSKETERKSIAKSHDFQRSTYDIDILDQNIIITGISFLHEREDSHGTKTTDWTLNIFMEKTDKRLQVVTNHAYVKDIIAHFKATPGTPLRCRITTQGEAQAKRYKLAEPEEK